MSRYFKLIDAIDTPQVINVARQLNGVVTYGHVRLFPGEKYELGDDEIFIKSLKRAEAKKQYSDSLIKMLDELGVKYRTDYCKSCGGKVRKIFYSTIEVVDDGD